MPLSVTFHSLLEVTEERKYMLSADTANKGDEGEKSQHSDLHVDVMCVRETQ